MPRTNPSWRAQAKPVLCIASDTTTEFTSLWQAATWVSDLHHCLHATARKEIRRAIRTGSTRYGCQWQWKQPSESLI